MASDDEAPWLQHVPTEQILAELARRTGATNYNPAPVADAPATHTEKPPPQGDGFSVWVAGASATGAGL